MFNRKKKLKGLKLNDRQLEVLEYNTYMPFDVMKERRQKKKDIFKMLVSSTILFVIAGGALRSTGVVEKTDFHTNNEENIQNNLKVIGYDDSIFQKSPLNKEIILNGKKNLTVGVNKNLGEDNIECLKEATLIMNNILQGLNPEYSIRLTNVDSLAYRSCDVVVNDMDDGFLKFKNAISNTEQSYWNLMSEFSNTGVYNNNVSYKGRIFVNTEFWEDYKDVDDYKEFLTTTYLHEMCHAIFGFDDIYTKEYSLMDYNDPCNMKTLFYYDLLNAAASICDLTNEEEKTRVYNFICKELMKQLDSDYFDDEYKAQAANKIAELQADLALNQPLF